MEDSNEHENYFFSRNFLTIWERALKSVRQPWSTLTAGVNDLP
jgi:hypothetical protein